MRGIIPLSIVFALPSAPDRFEEGGVDSQNRREERVAADERNS